MMIVRPATILFSMAMTMTVLARSVPNSLSQVSAESLSGHVVSESREPIVGAILELRYRSDVVTVVSDSTGKFSFKSVPVGRYELSASKPGYAVARYGAGSPDEPTVPVAVSQEGNAPFLEVVLRKGSVISGKLIDELGVPIPSARLTPMRWSVDPTSGAIGFVALEAPAGWEANYGSTSALDGSFRLINLPAGRYTLRASGKVPFFYPSVRTQANAAAIELLTGTVTDVRFIVPPLALETHRVAGRVSKAAAGLQRVHIVASHLDVGFRRSTLANSDGHFLLEGLIPGTYSSDRGRTSQ